MARSAFLQAGRLVEGTDSLEFGLELAPGDFQIVGLLGAKPVAIGETEEAAEAQVGIGSDGPTSEDDLADALRRHADLFSKSVLRQTQALWDREGRAWWPPSGSRLSEHLRAPLLSNESRCDIGR